MSGSWFQTGNDGWERARREAEEAKARRQSDAPWRFRQKPNNRAKITFMENPHFFLHEHTLRYQGRWTNETCLGEWDTCPLCEAGIKRSYVLVTTIINHSPYTTKKGEVIKNQKQLFVAKNVVRDRLGLHIQRRDGDLSFCVYEIARGSADNECATGEDMEFLGRTSRDKLRIFIPDGESDDWLSPFDYAKILAPKSVEVLSRMVGAAPPVGGASDERGGGVEDDIPFDDGDDSPNTEAREVGIEDLI